MIWKAQPFDTKIIFSNAKLGQVVEKFPTGDFVVKCNDGSLLITDYEGKVSKRDILVINKEKISRLEQTIKDKEG